MRIRPSKVSIYMKVAESIALLSHDGETQVGATLLSADGSIIAVSFNGHVRGAPDDIPTVRPDKYKHMIHAEQNLITNCARLGISMKNCTVVCTKTPCATCTRLLWQAGVTTIIAKEKYSDFDSEVVHMRDIYVTSTYCDGGFIRVALSNRKDHDEKCIAYRDEPIEEESDPRGVPSEHKIGGCCGSMAKGCDGCTCDHGKLVHGQERDSSGFAEDFGYEPIHPRF